ncbi:MAG: DUF3302 domain-containing protein [Motiliproteus sp.]
MLLDYAALVILVFAAITLFYGVIVIHDIPYEIAVHRDHPHQDAIHVAGWVSLFTLHVIWPFLWIWATLYRKDRGWGFNQPTNTEQREIDSLREEIHALKLRMDSSVLGGSTTLCCDKASNITQEDN